MYHSYALLVITAFFSSALAVAEPKVIITTTITSTRTHYTCPCSPLTTTSRCTLDVCTNPAPAPVPITTTTTSRCTLDVCTNPAPYPPTTTTTTTTTTPTPTETCGAIGAVPDPSSQLSIGCSIQQIGDCQQSCLDHADCESIAERRSDNACCLYSKPVSELYTTGSADGNGDSWYYFDRSCPVLPVTTTTATTTTTTTTSTTTTSTTTTPAPTPTGVCQTFEWPVDALSYTHPLGCTSLNAGTSSDQFLADCRNACRNNAECAAIALEYSPRMCCTVNSIPDPDSIPITGDWHWESAACFE